VNGLPKTLAQWRVALMSLLGALVGILTIPALWPTFGPLRAAAFVLSRCAAESRYGEEIEEGDVGAAGEVGPLQFTQAGLNKLPDSWRDDPSWRPSAFWSGWATLLHLRYTLGLDWRYYVRSLIPWVGMGFAHYQHVRSIPSGLDGDNAEAVKDAIAASATWWGRDRQELARSAALWWRGISLIPVGLVAYAIAKD